MPDIKLPIKKVTKETIFKKLKKNLLICLDY